MLPINTLVSFKKDPEDPKSKELYGKIIGYNANGEVFIDWTSPECRLTKSGTRVESRLFRRSEADVIPVIVIPDERTDTNSN